MRVLLRWVEKKYGFVFWDYNTDKYFNRVGLRSPVSLVLVISTGTLVSIGSHVLDPRSP